MKLAVLVRQVPDTWSERKLNPADGVLDRAASDAVLDEIVPKVAAMIGW